MSNQTPEKLKYTREHEWGKLEGEILTIGITDFAQSSLGDIVFIELPEIGVILSKGDAFGVVESIKSVSDLYSPVSGEVLEVNSALEEQPEDCNSDPYGAWIIKIKMARPDEMAELMSAQDYQLFCSSA